MTSDQNQAATTAEESAALALALKQSQDVKEKVEACADDLASVNDAVKKKIAVGVTILPAQKALLDTKKVEVRVQECAEDLDTVHETLAHGIDDLKLTETALAKSRNALANTEEDLRQTVSALTVSRSALAETEAALAVAQEEMQKARQRALHDAMTGLPNRALFDNRLAQAISMAERRNWTLAVMFLDLDHFKNINDTHGHAAGDAVLKEVAKRLLQQCRHEDTVCRISGDEFLYLLINPQGNENIERVARTLLKSINQPVALGELQLANKASIGIAVYPDHGTTGEQLIKNADNAMYRAKKHTSGCAFFNAPEDVTQAAGLKQQVTRR